MYCDDYTAVWRALRKHWPQCTQTIPFPPAVLTILLHTRWRAWSVTGCRTWQLPQKSAVKTAQEQGLGFDQELEPNLLRKTEALQEEEATICNNSKHWLPSKHPAGLESYFDTFLKSNFPSAKTPHFVLLDVQRAT